MSKLANQWIEIFRAGDYGAKGTFTEADLDQVVANYQPGTHEAPAVIGHPKENAPAFGWFDGVKRAGKVLLGKMHQVEPAFGEMVEAGRFKKRSASFYRTPNGLSLRHVGWLGAQPPEVKGLADFKFADTTESVELEFQESDMAAEETLIERLNAWFEAKFPKAAPTLALSTPTFSEADVRRIATEAVTAAVTPMQAKLDAQAVQFSERETRLSGAETVARANAAVTRLKAAGKYVPAFDKLGLPLVFAELAKTTDVVEFGEGDAKKSQTPLEVLVSFMEDLKTIVPKDPVYTGQTATGTTTVTGAGNINTNGRAPADPNSIALDKLVSERMVANKVDRGTALAQIATEKPELTVPGGTASGQV